MLSDPAVLLFLNFLIDMMISSSVISEQSISNSVGCSISISVVFSGSSPLSTEQKIFPHSCFVLLCRVCWDRGHLGLLLFLSVFLCDFCCRFLLLFCLLRRNVFGFPVVHPRFLMECSFCFSLFFSSISFHI